jgi:membrane protein implicated in regulation of membrane protease activity
MDSPEQWRWLWLFAAAFFAIAEMVTPVSFFMAPFAVGSLAAAILAFAGVSVPIELIVFLVVSIATLIALRPLARRLDRQAIDDGVGSRRLIGRPATVTRDIPAGDEVGMVRVDREQWRAQSFDRTPLAEGAAVRVADVQGTRLIVAPVDLPPTPRTTPPAGDHLPATGSEDPPT